MTTFIIIVLCINAAAFVFWFFRDMFMSFVFTLLFAISVATVIAGWIFYRLFVTSSTQLESQQNLYRRLTAAMTFKEIVDILCSECREQGAYTIFLQKTEPGTLEGGGIKIDVLGHNLPSKAFFTLKTLRIDTPDVIDRDFERDLPLGTVFLPISKKPGPVCWQDHKCSDNTCVCSGEKQCDCWLLSGNRYRGQVLPSRKEKYYRCARCRSFRPIGVFAMQGDEKAIRIMIDFINEHSNLLTSTFIQQSKYNYILRERNYCRNHDSLFEKAVNRNGLLRTLRDAYSSDELTLSICMIAIDGFNEIKAYGYYEANKTFEELSYVIIELAETTDDFGLARYGLEDFILIFEKDKPAAFESCENLRKKIETHFFSGGKKISVSIGIAALQDGTDPENLMEKVSVALDSARTISNTVICVGDAKAEPAAENQKDYLAL